MIDLNKPETFKHLDPKDVYGSTGMFADQCKQIWEDTKGLNFSQDYKNVENIILCGMGGSAYGGYVANALYKNELALPLYSNNDYTLPGFANDKSLVILSSYSGSTEESLFCGEEAYKKGCKVIGHTSGGKLSELLKSHNSPYLSFDPKFNPSGQPRLGTGYMVFGFLVLLSRLGFIMLTDDEVAKAVEELKENHEQIKSQAMELAQKIQGSIPIIMSSDFLNGNAHLLRNQFNETAKTFSAFEDIPELNHHLMEGLKNPPERRLTGLFITSELYPEIHKKRIELTKDVVGKNNVSVLEYSPKGETKLSQVLNTLAFGGYVTFYLGILYGQDPSVIPWVDYFKAELAKKSS